MTDTELRKLIDLVVVVHNKSVEITEDAFLKVVQSGDPEALSMDKKAVQLLLAQAAYQATVRVVLDLIHESNL